MYTLYFKPLEGKHDSGYQLLEIGYISADHTEKIVFRQIADVVHLWDVMEVGGFTGPTISMDVLDGGYIRIFPKDPNVKMRWRSPSFSDAFIELKDPTSHIKELKEN